MSNLEFHGEKENYLEKFSGEMLKKNEMYVKAKSINFMVKNKVSWRNAGEIPPRFL